MKSGAVENVLSRLRKLETSVERGTHYGFQQGIWKAAADEIERLQAIEREVNTPHTTEFLEAVKLEAAHQRQRWAAPHDAGKTDADWFWLVGYLAGKCLRCVITGDREKALHHTISSAAALANWYEAIKRDETGTGIGHDDDIRPIEIARSENSVVQP